MRRDAETEIERRGSVLTNVNEERKEKNLRGKCGVRGANDPYSRGKSREHEISRTRGLEY